MAPARRRPAVRAGKCCAPQAAIAAGRGPVACDRAMPGRRPSAVRPARSVLRGAHARAQLRAGAPAGRHPRHAAGAAARGRSRHRSRRPRALGSARPHRRARRRGGDRRKARRRAPAAPALARASSAEQIKALYRDMPFEEVPLDGMRKTIAARLMQAKQTIPHFYLTADVEIGRLLALREEANAAAPKDRTAIRRSSSRSTISSSRPGRRRCSACRPPTRCGRRTASCASSIPTSALRSRSKAG